MIARKVVLAGFVIGFGTGTAARQATGDDLLQVGDRIRITTSSSSSAIKGILVAADQAELTLTREGRESTHLNVARSDVAKLEVVRGKKSHWLAGALAGAGGGLALTALYCNDPPLGDTCDSGEWAGTAAFFGGIGAASGALVGALIRTDRWETVPADGLKVSVSPVPGHGLALALRLTF